MLWFSSYKADFVVAMKSLKRPKACTAPSGDVH
jgi:hypothetical protein